MEKSKIRVVLEATAKCAYRETDTAQVQPIVVSNLPPGPKNIIGGDDIPQAITDNIGSLLK